jgi:hypothetical protein
MPSNPASISEDRIRAIAHSLWLEEGRPDGRAEIHWFKALELVNAEAQAVSRAPAKAEPKRKATVKAAAATKAPGHKTAKRKA